MLHVWEQYKNFKVALNVAKQFCYFFGNILNKNQ